MRGSSQFDSAPSVPTDPFAGPPPATPSFLPPLPAANAPPPTNAAMAQVFDQVALMLAEQGANLYRVRAYKQAGAILRDLDDDAAALYAEGGAPALDALP